MDENINTLVEAAKEAKEQAYAPYSNFRVGAAVLSKGGRIYKGCNVENTSYGLTICAERNAIFRMVSEGEQEIAAICIVGETKDPLPPCGACRQVIAEFAPKSAPIYMCNKEGKWEKKTVEEMIPQIFSLKDRGKSQPR